MLTYHMSPSSNRASITQRGLDPTMAFNYDPEDGFGEAVHLSTEPMPHQGIDVWQVDAAGLDLAEDHDQHESPGQWYVTTEPIGPERLTLATGAERR